MKKPSHDALNFVRSKDGDLESLMLAACLTALGIPFSERPALSVSGDTEPVVNWLFDEQSLDGKFKASEMIAKWNDKGWITRADNDHPLAYMAAAMRNLYTLINHHIGQAPNVELVKRGHKTLLIPRGARIPAWPPYQQVHKGVKRKPPRAATREVFGKTLSESSFLMKLY